MAQPLDTGSVVTAAQSGRADVAAGNWYCTAARAKVVDLAGPVYTDQIGIISPNGAKTFSELQGKPMGTVDGYLWNDEFKKIYGDNLKIYPNPTAMYTDLKAGRIQVAADSFGSATYANDQNGKPWKVVVPEADSRVAASEQPPQVCFPMGKQNAALYKAVNEDLVKLRESGKLADALKQAGLDKTSADTGQLRLI